MCEPIVFSLASTALQAVGGMNQARAQKAQDERASDESCGTGDEHSHLTLLLRTLSCGPMRQF